MDSCYYLLLWLKKCIYKKLCISKNMKRIVINLLLLLSMNLGFSQTILWSEERQLSWEDFKGYTRDWEVAAVTYCGFTMASVKQNIWNGKFMYEAYAEFECDSSFFFPDLVSDDVLSHEQLHFDNAELFARKLNQELVSRSFITEEQANILYKTCYEQYFEYQSKYEEETELGTNLKEQEKWNNQVEEELEELKEFHKKPTHHKD